MSKIVKNVYFIGIGGIGMSAIARYYKFKGMAVSGYDRTPSELTAALEKEGIDIHYKADTTLIPGDTDDTLVVYTPAIPADFEELRFVQEKGYRVIKRSRMLGEITGSQTCIAVAGTHGKTTTSTLIAHILTESGKGCSAFLGGISKNYGTNLLTSDTPVMVAEADEFDRSFLQLYPAIAVITSIDADHLDIYGDLDHVKEAFREFAGQVGESLIVKAGVDINGCHTQAKVFTYHLNRTDTLFHATNMRLDSTGHYTYDLVYPAGTLTDIKVGTLGWVNVENSIAAAAACLLYGIDGQKVRAAIGSFKGAKRRLDEHINEKGLTYIDDYAHHPEEIKAALSSLREVFRERKITAIFQPHLYTRTRDFAKEFAQALSLADKVILLGIYPAREEPIPGITSEIIFKDLDCREKCLIDRSELMTYLEKENVDVLVTLGAGDIDRFIEPISEMLSKRK